MVIDSKSSEAAPPASRGPKKTFTDNLYSTFSSPLAWILVLALIITWSCVFVIMFDLADYKTVSGEQRRLLPRVCNRCVSTGNTDTGVCPLVTHLKQVCSQQEVRNREHVVKGCCIEIEAC